MKTFNVYRSFIREYQRIPEPLWQGLRGRLLDYLVEMTPRRVKECCNKQYHSESKNEYPLWFLGDALQGHIPHEFSDDEMYAENIADFENFIAETTKLLKKYNIAPKGWIKWYSGCR